MWVLDNQTPFAAERAWVRDQQGAEVWLVAVKATYRIEPDGPLSLAEDQDAVCLAPVFRGAPESSSLLSDSDLYHYKTKTDVIVEGHATAPGGQPVGELDVALSVGPIKKVLRVYGDRVWKQSLLGVSISRPSAFLRMPVTYERAFGGSDASSDKPDQRDWEARNPVGQGFATHVEHLIDKPLPNIEDPACLIETWSDRPGPAGFGPIAGHWSPRVEQAGTYDSHWEAQRQPLLPDDFNDSFYQCAPAEQQVPEFLHGGERVVLVNMTPEGRIEFQLPEVALGFATQFEGSRPIIHRGDLHTVRIDTDEKKVSLVWQSHLECHHQVLKLLDTTIYVKQTMLAPEPQEQGNDRTIS